MHTVDYAAVGFLIACMIWAAAMTLKPDTVKPRAQGGEKRRQLSSIVAKSPLEGGEGGRMLCKSHRASPPLASQHLGRREAVAYPLTQPGSTTPVNADP
jgi:hypothetical protein